MRVAKAVANLTEAFERLPSIGPKTAQRLTYYLLHVPQGELDKFADSLENLQKNTVECALCHNIAEISPCDICGDRNRDQKLICVVEQPLDILALESGNRFTGVYHVLHGVIDPLHNIGPEEIKLNELIERIKQNQPNEIILALNPTMEGEATCLYLKKQIEGEKLTVSVTRIAHGLPMGADIQYADDQTLSHALEGRREYWDG